MAPNDGGGRHAKADGIDALCDGKESRATLVKHFALRVMLLSTHSLQQKPLSAVLVSSCGVAKYERSFCPRLTIGLCQLQTLNLRLQTSVLSVRARRPNRVTAEQQQATVGYRQKCTNSLGGGGGDRDRTAGNVGDNSKFCCRVTLFCLSLYYLPTSHVALFNVHMLSVFASAPVALVVTAVALQKYIVVREDDHYVIRCSMEGLFHPLLFRVQ